MKSYRKIYTGKVRSIYENTINTNLLLMKATDRLSCFDRYICDIPYKGIVLNKISIWWFNKTKNDVPNHFLKERNNDEMIVKRTKPFPIEFIVRKYMTGTTNTSIWKNYEVGCRRYCGNTLRDDYRKNEKLDKTILTPTTKGFKDELIDEHTIISNKIMTEEEWNICKNYSLKLFEIGEKIALEKGLILVDTKYEFGKDEFGNILLIDELHTPDSSRYWISETYLSNFENGMEPDNIDKDIIRKNIIKRYDPYEPCKIDISSDLIEKTYQRYIKLLTVFTGLTIVDII